MKRGGVVNSIFFNTLFYDGVRQIVSHLLLTQSI